MPEGHQIDHSFVRELIWPTFDPLRRNLAWWTVTWKKRTKLSKLEGGHLRKDGHLLMGRTILYSTSMKHMPPFSSQCYICEVANHKCHGFQLQWQLHWLCKYQKSVDTKLRDIEAALETRLVIPFVDINYRMVGNFREGFIFVFFASQEPFAKIKPRKFHCPRAKWTNHISIQPPTEACQRVYLWRLSLKLSRKSKC